jgi:hypothetical protein
MSRASVSHAVARPAPLPSLLSAEDAAAHREFVATLGGEPVWLRYLDPA